MVVNEFNLGTAAGMQSLLVQGAGIAELCYNPSNNTTLVVYSGDNNTDLLAREWNGTIWSGAMSVFTGATTISRISVQARPVGIGVAFYDTASNLRLAEYNNATWAGPSSLGTDALNLLGDLGLSYNPDGSYAVVVERQGADPGIYLGVDPLGTGAGGALAWEEIQDTGGNASFSCMTFYQSAPPVVAYYHSSGGLNSSNRIRLYESFGGTWYMSEFTTELHGLPIGTLQDANGDIVMLGNSLSTIPNRAVVVVLSE
jgi:hypothetical protein